MSILTPHRFEGVRVMRAAEQEFLTVAEAATFLRVSPSTVRRWIRKGDVPAYRVGRRRVALKRDDLSNLIRPARPMGATSYTIIEDEKWEPRRLTPEEKQRALEAMDRAQRHAEETRARRGGKLFPSSWITINEQRDERTRQLS
jgi:excisionase family DNA binding protein